MKHTLLLAAFAIAGTTACSEAASEPTAVQTEALVASASAWTPEELTRDLQVDDATRAQIEAGIRELHTSMVALHGRYESAQALQGAARATSLAALETDMKALHEQHRALWDSLDPAVQETLAARFHERMRAHDGETASSIHERMRRLHAGDDGAGH